MKDKKPLVLQEEYGKDEDGTQVDIANVCVCVCAIAGCQCLLGNKIITIYACIVISNPSL